MTPTDMTPADAPILAELQVAPARWLFGVVMLFSLGGLVVLLGFSAPNLGPFWRFGLLALGIVFLISGERSRRARGARILLTDEGLSDSSGRIIAAFEEIQSVDRGALAFKPSNGFLLRIRVAHGRAWVPGLWWRLGRWVGIGGSTPSGAGKFMAEAIALKLAERERDHPV